jgi:adenylosuccinate synthase
MKCVCVVGLQWGDEAKGKIVDLIADQFDVVVRYNGGANAGHTVVWGDRTFKLSLLPTGVLRPEVTSVIANGVVIYPPKFLDEIRQLRDAGINVGANLAVSDHAHVIFPYHMEEERLSEQGDTSPIGTTGRGIGPCYQDKVGRVCAIRVGDLLKPEKLRDRLNYIVPRKNRWLAALANGKGDPPKVFESETLAKEYLAFGEQLRPHVTDTARLLNQALDNNKRVLFEAAQGSLLDVDHGTYPYVTSSNSSPAGIWTGSGVPARRLDKVIGVIKAYTTRVGRGPFPTELDDGPQGIGERIRKVGREYGTVTGRPRRVGWFDVVAARYSLTLAGADELALMLLDVLSGLVELKIATAYQLPNGQKVDHFPSDPDLLAQCVPVYETAPGWSEDITTIRKRSDLPSAAVKYIERLQQLLGRRISIISVGPDRQQTIVE